MGLPTIDIIFKQLAVSAINRSARGRVGLIVKDDTDDSFTSVTYKMASEIDEDLFTAANVEYITDCFVGTPSQVTVIRTTAATPNIEDALTIAGGLKLDWIGIAEGTQTEQEALATWIKSQELLKKTYKGIVYNPTTAPDSKQVVNFTNAKVTFTDARGEVTGEKYVATLLGIAAGLPLNKSLTYYVLPNLSSVEEPADVNAAIDAGKLVLINDEGKVRIGAGVNSLTTVDTNNTEDMKQIVVVEAMNLIMNDIRDTFKNSYIGRYKNKYDNQVLLISAINSYFNALEVDDILDPAYSNMVDVDVEAQRQAWLSIGKTEASDWTAEQVKDNTFRNNVYLNADIKVLGAIENLKLNINLF
jgi:hypothetical protein